MKTNNFDYEKELRSIEYSKYHFNSIEALLRYKSDSMLELNKARLLSDIDLVINTLTELKASIKSK